MGLGRRSSGLQPSLRSIGLQRLSTGLRLLSLRLSMGLLAALSRLAASGSSWWPRCAGLPASSEEFCPGGAQLLLEGVESLAWALLLVLLALLPQPPQAPLLLALLGLLLLLLWLLLLLFRPSGPRASRPVLSSSSSSRRPDAAFSSTITRSFAWNQKVECGA